MKCVIFVLISISFCCCQVRGSNGQLGRNYAIPDTNKLIFWLKAESNSLDSSGKGNNGIEQGHIAYKSGFVGQAFEFTTKDGNKPTVRIPPDSSLNPKQVTIEAWVNPYSLDSPNKVHVILRRNITRSGLPQYALLIGDGVNSIVPTCNFFNAVGLKGKKPIPVNEWTHLACTFEKGIARLYRNGEIIDERRIEKPLPESFRSAYVGRESDYSRSFNGLIDELTLYGKALSPEQIRGIYQASDLGKERIKNSLKATKSSDTKLVRQDLDFFPLVALLLIIALLIITLTLYEREG